ncbi:hypothetical protein FRC02_002374 [Tulasnella sp. 418]|nr:hypothetical protein FRC02_002374 [Tulasnella sp. 418]
MVREYLCLVVETRRRWSSCCWGWTVLVFIDHHQYAYDNINTDFHFARRRETLEYYLETWILTLHTLKRQPPLAIRALLYLYPEI